MVAAVAAMLRERKSSCDAVTQLPLGELSSSGCKTAFGERLNVYRASAERPFNDGRPPVGGLP